MGFYFLCSFDSNGWWLLCHLSACFCTHYFVALWIDVLLWVVINTAIPFLETRLQISPFVPLWTCLFSAPDCPGNLTSRCLQFLTPIARNLYWTPLNYNFEESILFSSHCALFNLGSEWSSERWDTITAEGSNNVCSGNVIFLDLFFWYCKVKHSKLLNCVSLFTFVNREVKMVCAP